MFSLMLEAYDAMIENDLLDDDEDIQDECGKSCNEDDDLMDDSEVEDDIDTFGDM